MLGTYWISLLCLEAVLIKHGVTVEPPRWCWPGQFLLHPGLLLWLSVPNCPVNPLIFLFCTLLQQRFPHLLFFPGTLLLLTQACQHGNSQHLEHLLFYGADSASQNASGNTALHICALYNKVPGDFREDFC